MCKTTKQRWSEISSDYIDDDNFCYIDVWEEGQEQGKTIAWVDMLSGRVIYGNSEARVDQMVQVVICELIKKVKKEHPFSVKELEGILFDVVDFECEEIGAGPDVRINLYSLGFNDETMKFFGYPETLGEE